MGRTNHFATLAFFPVGNDGGPVSLIGKVESVGSGDMGENLGGRDIERLFK